MLHGSSSQQSGKEAAPWMTEQSFKGEHCSPPWHEKGVIKATLKITYLKPPWPACRGWQGIPLSGRNRQHRRPAKSHKLARNHPITLGAWNVRTPLDRERAKRPARICRTCHKGTSRVWHWHCSPKRNQKGGGRPTCRDCLKVYLFLDWKEQW